MRIEVTQRDIDFGRKEESTLCPVALAIKRQLVNVDSVSVGVTHLLYHIQGDEDMTEVLLPPEVKHFVNRFDYGHEVFPFEFEISISTQTQITQTEKESKSQLVEV